MSDTPRTGDATRFQEVGDGGFYYVLPEDMAELELDYNKLRAELEAARECIRRKDEALDWWQTLREESKGLAGFHLNGAVAHWGEFVDPTDAALAITPKSVAAKKDL